MYNPNAGKIIVCIHCGDKCGKDYCVKCNTLEKRIAQDKENAKHFKENGLEFESPCKKCQAELEKLDKKKKR